jgi:hypothetical protein
MPTWLRPDVGVGLVAGVYLWFVDLGVGVGSIGSGVGVRCGSLGQSGSEGVEAFADPGGAGGEL